MRNGDYVPTRYAAQNDAVSLVFNAKTNSNPENTCGVMSMAGQAPQVLATLTQDLGKVLSALNRTHISSQSDLPTALKIAQLALKHRENKNQRQRIIVFLGSPLGDQTAVQEAAIVKLGRGLKKNNVAVDVVLFGDEGMENEPVMTKFIETVQNNENSNLVSIPPGPHLLSDLLATSAVLAGDNTFTTSSNDDVFGGAPAEGGADHGIDPNMDPELAMALRMSLEEEEERQRRAAASSSSSSTQPGATADAQPEASSSTGPVALSSGEDVNMDAPAVESTLNPTEPTHLEGEEIIDLHMDQDEDDEDEEEAMLRAIAMSMEQQPGDPSGDQEKKE